MPVLQTRNAVHDLLRGRGRTDGYTSCVCGPFRLRRVQAEVLQDGIRRLSYYANACAKGKKTMKNLKNNKYGNKKVKIGGETFDSRRELRRWAELNILLRAKKIANLERQVKFELIPVQCGEDGKDIERECSYIADFVYDDLERGEHVVEDAKGFRTPEYKIKRKLMLWLKGIKIEEV